MSRLIYNIKPHKKTKTCLNTAFIQIRNLRKGVHILRELNGIIENNPRHTWAKRCKDILLNMLNTKKSAIVSRINKLDNETLKRYSEEYDNVFQIAEKECPPPQESKEKKRGRKPKGKERALIERLIKLKNSVCLFTKDFAVPFDNNQAERDVRNVKTKSKVSGCFQSLDGAQNYLTIMSYLSTRRDRSIAVKKLKNLS